MEVITPEINRMLKTAHRALKSNPRDMQLHSDVAAMYEQTGRYSDALSHLAAMWRTSGEADENVCVRYAFALHRSGEFAKALQIVNRGLAGNGRSVALLKQKALILSLLGDYGVACEVYLELYRIDPLDSHSRAMAGMLRMLVTDLREGFEDYACRPQDKGLSKLVEPIPRWSGEALAAKRLLLWAEQGVGDVIMFLGLVPWLTTHGRSSVSILVTAKLAPLLERAFPYVTVLSEASVSQFSSDSYDYQLPLGDLFHFALPAYVPSEHGPYLQADGDRVARLREQYMAVANARKRTYLVGVSWHTTNPHVGFIQNISLEELAPLFGLPHVQFVSLQYGNHWAELESINRRFKDVVVSDNSVDAYNDMDGLAAQMCAMDQIVSISNVTVHLAGALGVPTTFLAPAMVDWRWGLSGSDSKWYQSVRVERQEVLLKWQPVIKRVRARLLEDTQTR